MSLKYLAKEHNILITDSVTDLLHSAMVAFEQAFSCGDTQFLQVDQRAVSSGLFKTANEITQAHADVLSWSFKRECLMKILV